jgi:uncharacterized delta-60 repeat protein
MRYLTLTMATVAATAITAAPAAAAPGDLDSSFASAGRFIATTPPLSDTQANSVAIQRDGKIVTAGGTDPGSAKGFTVARFNSNGTPDLSFGPNGTSVVRFGARRDAATAYAVAIDRRGRIVVGGTWSKQIQAGNGEQDPEFHHTWALARLARDGKRDRSFGRGGKVTTRALPGAITALALTPRGKIVAVGARFAVARYRSSGRLDRSFSRDGKRTVRFLKSGSQRASAVALTARGRIVVAGVAAGRGFGALGHYALAQLKTGGALDRRFGQAGRTFGHQADRGIRDMKVDRRGRIVVTGDYERRGSHATEIEVARYTRRGRLDGSFGRGGRAATRIGSSAYPGGLALARDGKIVVGGNVLVMAPGDSGSSANFLVARFTAGGRLDTSFAGDGVQTTAMGSSVFDTSGNDVALQRDGKIVLIGFAGEDHGTVLARYLAN